MSYYKSSYVTNEVFYDFFGKSYLITTGGDTPPYPFNADNIVGDYIVWGDIRLQRVEEGGGGGSADYKQVIRLNAPANTDIQISVTSNTLQKRPPVEVLKYESSGYDDITETLNEFTQDEVSYFQYNTNYVSLDGSMHFKVENELNMSTPTNFGSGYLSESNVINIGNYSAIGPVDTYDRLVHLRCDSTGIFDLVGNTVTIRAGSPVSDNTNPTPINQNNDFYIDMGVSGYLSIGDLGTLRSDTPWCLSFWHYPVQKSTTRGLLVGFTKTSGGAVRFAVYYTNGKYGVRWNSDTINYSSTESSLDTWHHIAFANDPNNGVVDLFVDGVRAYRVNSMNIDVNYFACGFSNDVNYGCILDLCLFTGRSFYTDSMAPFMVPTKYMPYYMNLYVDSTNVVYGIDSGSFVQVANDWSSLTNSEKEQLFIDCGNTSSYLVDTSIISSNFKLLSYSDVNIKPNNKIQLLPNPCVILPKKLYPIPQYLWLDSASVDYTLSGSGVIKIAVTDNLNDYYIYENGSWVTINVNNISTDGMIVGNFNLIPEASWNDFTQDLSNIAFAYYISCNDIDDVADIDSMVIQGDLDGAWVSAVKGEDFTYSYISAEKLVVNLINAGDYRINYPK